MKPEALKAQQYNHLHYSLREPRSFVPPNTSYSPVAAPKVLSFESLAGFADVAVVVKGSTGGFVVLQPVYRSIARSLAWAR